MQKIGIIGLGHLGEIHLKQWIEIVGVQNIVCMDVNQEMVRKISNIYNVSFVTTLDELFKDTYIIDVVTPTQFHYEYAKQAILNGKHVFIEKPVCSSVAEALELETLSKENQVKIQVGHVERFNPAFQSVKDWVKDPLFFEIHRLAPYNPRGTEVSVIMDLMIHDLDIISHLVNSEVKNIYANGVCILNKTPDIANARIEFANGCVANLTASRISMKKMRKMRIFKNDMYSTIDFLEKSAEVYNIVSSESPEQGLIFNQYDGTEKKLIFKSPKVLELNSIFEELKYFKNSIDHSRAIEVTIQDAIKALDLAVKIQSKISQN